MIFSAVFGLVVYGLDQVVPGLAEQSRLARFGLFAILEFWLLRTERFSFGFSALGIAHGSANREQTRVEDMIWNGRIPVVDPAIRSRESLWTLLVGTFLVNDASKTLVRWTMWTPPTPGFGMEPWPELDHLMSLVDGAITLWCAWEILQTRARGAALVNKRQQSFAATSIESPASSESRLRPAATQTPSSLAGPPDPGHGGRPGTSTRLSGPPLRTRYRSAGSPAATPISAVSAAHQWPRWCRWYRRRRCSHGRCGARRRC
jgi:hypothetical protein